METYTMAYAVASVGEDIALAIMVVGIVFALAWIIVRAGKRG